MDHQEYLDRRVHRSLLSRAARVYFQSERWREKGRSLTASECAGRISRFLLCLLLLFFFLSNPRDHLSLYAGNYVRAIANGHETSANFNQISCDLSRKFVANARSQERALPRRLLRRWKRNVIAQANEQPWPRLQGRFDYYPAAVEDAAETHRSEAALDTSARNRRYSRY